MAKQAKVIRNTLFLETDAGIVIHPNKPTPEPNMPLHITFEEYQERLKYDFMMKFDKGILEARLHDGFGNPMLWGASPHRAIWKFAEWAGADPYVETVIFGGQGPDFVQGIRGDSGTKIKELRPMDEQTDHAINEVGNAPKYEIGYHDGTRSNEKLIHDLQVPTIGVWCGAAFHVEYVLNCDITICNSAAWTTDMHYRINMVPGDGIQIPLRELMGRKRFAYAELTGEIITAKRALELGLVNEIIDGDFEATYDRAWELADLIMHMGGRYIRRLTVQILRTPWKIDYAWENRHAFGSEQYGTLIGKSPHDNRQWRYAHAEAKVAIENEKNGIVELPVWGRMPDDQIPESTYADTPALYRHIGIQMGDGEDKFMSGIECHEDVRDTDRKDQAFTIADQEFESMADKMLKK